MDEFQTRPAPQPKKSRARRRECVVRVRVQTAEEETIQIQDGLGLSSPCVQVILIDDRVSSSKVQRPHLVYSSRLVTRATDVVGK